MKLFISSGIFIAFAALILSIQSQIQLGLHPIINLTLMIIFFGTFLVYNLDYILSIFKKVGQRADLSYMLTNKYKLFMIISILLSFIIILILLLYSKQITFIFLTPITFITLFYFIPFRSTQQQISRLRQVPYLKIFIISLVWSAITVILPLLDYVSEFNKFNLFTMFIERFIFIFSITIPFDIRDIQTDKGSGLKTIPSYFGEVNSYNIAKIAMILFFIITIIHYIYTFQYFIAVALMISSIITLSIYQIKQLRNHPLYYYGLLDGMMILQGVLVSLAYLIGK